MIEQEDYNTDDNIDIAATCLNFNVDSDITRAIKESMLKIDKYAILVLTFLLKKIQRCHNIILPYLDLLRT